MYNYAQNINFRYIGVIRSRYHHGMRVGHGGLISSMVIVWEL